jgi:hypothetical protein
VEQLDVFRHGQDAGVAREPWPSPPPDKQRDRAVRQVETAADKHWRQDALEAVKRTCRELDTFISDDVWEHGLDSTREDRALGPILQKAAREGWCVKTDRVRPSRRSHMAGKPVWRSLLRPAP